MKHFLYNSYILREKRSYSEVGLAMVIAVSPTGKCKMYRGIFSIGLILFLNSSNSNWATIMYHSSKEAEIRGILCDTCE